jgi:hypothetical protein
MAENQSDEARRTTYLGPTTYDFASGIVVTQPNEMVYLDFFQLDLEGGAATSDQYGVARVVIHPALVRSLVDQLSTLRPPPEDEASPSSL